MSPEEFEVVYERTRGPLRAYLVRASGDVALADDLLQDAYYRFLTMAPDRRAAAPEKPLLFRLASNALHDHFRRFRRAERHAARTRSGQVADSVRGADTASADVARVFADLALREQTLLWLAYVEGMSHDEIAQALDLRSGSIRVLLFRARRAFAGLLRAYGVAPRGE